MASNRHSSSSLLIFLLVVRVVLTTSTVAAAAAAAASSLKSTISPPAPSPKHQWSASPPAEPLPWLPSSQPLKSRRLLPAASSPQRESPANPSPPAPPNLSPQSPESLSTLKSSRWRHASPGTEIPVTLVQSPVTLKIPTPSRLLSSQSLNPTTAIMDPPRESLEKISAQLNKIMEFTVLSSTTVLGKGRQERDMEIIKMIVGFGGVYGLIQLVCHVLKFIEVARNTNQYRRPNESGRYSRYRNLIGGFITWPTFYGSEEQAVQHEEIELSYYPLDQKNAMDLPLQPSP